MFFHAGIYWPYIAHCVASLCGKIALSTCYVKIYRGVAPFPLSPPSAND